MKLTFLGTRGEVEEASKFHKNHSALFLRTHGKIILLDFGASWQGKLKLFNPDFIWLSHAHPDHALGLKGEKVGVPVFMTEETSKKLPKDKFPLLDRRIVKGSFEFSSIQAQEIPVRHSTTAPTSGLIIHTDEGKVGYFPDVLDIPDKSCLEGLSVYIGDGSSLTRNIVRMADGKKAGHLSIIAQMKWCQGVG